MILAPLKDFSVKTSLFIALHGRHLKPSYLACPELEKLALDSRFYRYNRGAKLGGMIGFRLKTGGRFFPILNTCSRDEDNTRRASLFFKILKLVLKAKSQTAKNRQKTIMEIEKALACKLRLAAGAAPHISFAISLTNSHGKLAGGQKLPLYFKSTVRIIGTWLNLKDHQFRFEIGASCVPKELIEIRCPYCGRKMQSFAYTIRRFKTLCSGTELNADSNEVNTIYLRLARFCCSDASLSKWEERCCESRRREQDYSTHVAAPNCVVPFLSFNAEFINDVLTIKKDPAAQQRIQNKPIYAGCWDSFKAVGAEHLKTWEFHDQVLTDKLKECPLAKGLAEHERDKNTKQKTPTARDASRRRFHPEKIIAGSFVRKYKVLLSEWVLKLTTYYFYRPKERPFRLQP